MKIIFTKNLKRLRDISLSKEYPVIGYYTDLHGDGYMRHCLIVNDIYEPVYVNIDYPLNAIECDEMNFNHQVSVVELPYTKSVMPPNINIDKVYVNRFDGSYDLGWWALRREEIWAITQFVRGVNKIGFQTSNRLNDIAFSDMSKMMYVNGLMKGIFEGVMNYLSGCSNSSYYFEFKSIRNMRDLSLLPLSDYVESIFEFVMYHVFEYDQRRLKGNATESDEHNICMHRVIQSVILTLRSIYDYKTDLKVYKADDENIYPHLLRVIFDHSDGREIFQMEIRD